MRDQSYGHKESTRPAATLRPFIRKLATALRSRQAREAHDAHFKEPKPCTWAPDDDELAAACALRLGAVLDELPPSGTALNDLCCLLVSIFRSARKKRREPGLRTDEQKRWTVSKVARTALAKG